MPPKRGVKKGQQAKAKGSAGSSKAASASKASIPASAKLDPTIEEKQVAAQAKEEEEAKAQQTEPEVGTKRIVRDEPDATPADLQATLQRRHKLTEELQAVEKQIYDLETRYLENSHPLGNAVKGYEGLLSQSQASNRRILVKQEDRLFSNSSATGVPH